MLYHSLLFTHSGNDQGRFSPSHMFACKTTTQMGMVYFIMH